MFTAQGHGTCMIGIHYRPHIVPQRQGMKHLLMTPGSTDTGAQWQRFLAGTGQVLLLFIKNQLVAYKYHILIMLFLFQFRDHLA